MLSHHSFLYMVHAFPKHATHPPHMEYTKMLPSLSPSTAKSHSKIYQGGIYGDYCLPMKMTPSPAFSLEKLLTFYEFDAFENSSKCQLPQYYRHLLYARHKFDEEMLWQ